MMNIKIICVGKLKEDYLKDGIVEYAKRLSRFCKLEILEVAEELCTDNSPKIIQQVKNAEGARILEQVKGFAVALDLKGKNLTSEQISQKITKLKRSGVSTMSFIIGGSYGLSQDVLNKCDSVLCFGPVTFPHQLMRLILVEQIYRAFMIEEGSAYHT